MALRGTTTGRFSYELASHVGCVREANEDAAGACKDTGVVVVADGMGGHVDGAKASQTAVNEVLEAVRQGQSLTAAILAADAAIAAYIDQHPASVGMGTTVVAARVDDKGYEVAWVGDSRAYLWHGGLKRLTRDHSQVQRRINAGEITIDQEADQADRNILERALMGEGISEQEVGRSSGKLFAGEVLILCSDGLHGMASDRQIAAAVAPNLGKDPADVLVQLALDEGGDDNVTVAVIAPPTDAPKRPFEGGTREVPSIRAAAPAAQPRRSMRGNRMLIGSLVLILFFIVLALAWTFRRDEPAAGGAGGPLILEAQPEAEANVEGPTQKKSLQEQLQGPNGESEEQAPEEGGKEDPSDY